jgi:hypothetical protein
MSNTIVFVPIQQVCKGILLTLDIFGELADLIIIDFTKVGGAFDCRESLSDPFKL